MTNVWGWGGVGGCGRYHPKTVHAVGALIGTHLLPHVLAGLEDVYQPLQLVGGVSGVHHQPEVLPSAEVHVEGHDAKPWLDHHRIEAPVPGETRREDEF